MHPAGRYDSELALHSLMIHYKAVENRDGKTLLSTAKNAQNHEMPIYGRAYLFA